MDKKERKGTLIISIFLIVITFLEVGFVFPTLYNIESDIYVTLAFISIPIYFYIIYEFIVKISNRYFKR